MYEYRIIQQEDGLFTVTAKQGGVYVGEVRDLTETEALKIAFTMDEDCPWWLVTAVALGTA